MADDTLTPEEYAAWMVPREARRLVSESLGGADARPSLIGRLKGAVIKAVAGRASIERGGKVLALPVIYLIPAEHWVAWRDSDMSDLWGIGDVRIWYANKATREASVIRYYEIRFEPAGVYAMLSAEMRNSLLRPRPPPPPPWAAVAATPESPAPPPIAPTTATPSQPPTANRGGRPPHKWWTDLWIEMCRQLYGGFLYPKKQSDVENAMLTWLAEQGHDVTETTVRPAATKLFKVLIEKDEN